VNSKIKWRVVAMIVMQIKISKLMIAKIVKKLVVSMVHSIDLRDKK